MKLTVEMPWGKDLNKNHSRLPESARRNYKRHVKGWMNRLGWEVKAKMMALGVAALEPEVAVKVDFRYPDAQKRDDHNYYEVLCDALKGVVGMDDDQIRVSTGTIEIDRDNPGFTITVSDGQ